VAVTLFNARLRVGAICHALLADPGKSAHPSKNHPEPFKYVSLAIPAMLDIFRSRGIGLEETEVKLFGGANVLMNSRESWPEQGIGAVNVQRAKKLLLESNLRVSRTHVGGVVGRKLIFNTATGEVMLKQLSKPSTAATAPKRYAP
jgi:chemotaxis protein CheD